MKKTLYVLAFMALVLTLGTGKVFAVTAPAPSVETTTTTTSADMTVATTTIDFTPRIMMWYGKVNQHIDLATGMWKTDPNGTASASSNKLRYCQKFYPKTTKIQRNYKLETINTWRQRGNVGAWTATKPSIACIEETGVTSPTTVEVTTATGSTTTVPATVTTTPVSTTATATNTASTTPTNDKTARIAYWYGKVNQHIDIATGEWKTDNDGMSGADLNKLAYCKKFYPKTVSIKESYKTGETITTWKEQGNVNNWTATKPSIQCVQEKITETTGINGIPRIMYWYGKVNQHTDPVTGAWKTDSDGVSGALSNKLEYCRKFYPATKSTTDYKLETIKTWAERGNVNPTWEATKMSTRCVQ